MDPFMHYGFGSAVQAMVRFRPDDYREPTRRGSGSSWGQASAASITIEETDAKYLETKNPRKISPFFIPGSIINMVSGYISIRYGLQGPNLAVTACTTSTHADQPAARSRPLR